VSAFRFYLGVHHADWLEELPVPMFVSHHTLAGRRTLPRAAAPWACDSGGFTQLDRDGTWHTTPEAYVAAVRRYRDEIGNLQWCAPQDWMCEPRIQAKTGLSVHEHQARTVGSYLRLKELAPDLPFIPVLQGWNVPGDYDACHARYERAGIDLTREPVVGLGSVCRRQATGAIALLASRFANLGVRLHGFGVSTRGLGHFAADLVSSDSMAWSLGGRYLHGCAHGSGAKSEANCPHHALAWRRRVLAKAEPAVLQPAIPGL
jgi:hypothetical protein